jgi:hypothetical protein
MTQDFAKKRPSAKPTRDQSGERRFSLGTFFTGLVAGAFIAALAFFWYSQSAGDIPTVDGGQPKAELKAKIDEMQWDFYEIFPKLVVPIVEEYAQTDENTVSDNSSWTLQAGSFQDTADADQRRATLILMGLDVRIQEVKVAGVNWQRIMVGPFDSRLELNRAQDRLAQAEIPNIPIKTQASLDLR